MQNPTIHDQIADRLERYAYQGILPFFATVQVREDGAWEMEARGTSIDWLAGAADDAAEFGPVRVVSIYGEVIAGEGATA